MTNSTLDPSTELELAASAPTITLHDGTTLDLAGLDGDALQRLQWQEEPAYARLIAASPKGSPERARIVAQAYDAVCTILQRIDNPAGGPLEMGFDRRYVQLVLQVLARRTRTDGRRPRVFEIGYGSGSLLAALAKKGVDVGGIEVSRAMHDQACGRLPEACRDGLLVGSYLEHRADAGGYDVVYWNDVLEHLVPDEVPDFLRKIHGELAPGGSLVTLTPNWHLRPMDITRAFRPVRTTAVGFHLKEYTLRETTAVLRAAGFAQVGTPLFVTRGRIVLCGQGFAGVKRLCEPALEWLPYRLTNLLCRGFGLSCTIARKV